LGRAAAHGNNVLLGVGAMAENLREYYPEDRPDA
jgi:hypothetical protein